MTQKIVKSCINCDKSAWGKIAKKWGKYKGGIQKTKTGKIALKKYKGGGGGGRQRCQKDTTVPTISDFNAISTKNSRISTILWQKRTQRGRGGGPRVLYFLDAIFPVLVF